jgi:rhamnulokinase
MKAKRSSRSPVFAAAIDLGATSGRVILGRYARGRLDLEEVHRFSNAFHALGAHAYWDLGRLFEEVRTGLVAAAKRAPAGALASCGVDVWGVDTVLVNDAGRLVFPTHAYRDTRTEPYFSRLAKHGLADVFAWTGLPNLSYNTSLQLQEIVERCPLVTDLATRCLFLPDYFNFLLSGRMEVEISIASTSQLLDVHGGDFSRSALEHFRIPPTWFSKPLLSPARLGKVRGIPGLEKTLVTLVPGHDTSCAYDAMPAAEDGGDIYISSGTWSLIGFESDKPVLGAEALAAVVSNERLGDGRYRPIKNCLGLWLLEQTLPAFSTRPRNAADWAKLIRAAERAPAPAVLLDVTDRSLFNPKSMKDAIDAQLRRKKAKPPRDLAGYTRLICESLGQGHADAVRSFERMTGKKFKRILMVGGGSKNSHLCQTTADRSGLPVVSFALEGTAVGNLANQLVSLGAVESLRAFRRELGARLEQRTFTPAPR